MPNDNPMLPDDFEESTDPNQYAQQQVSHDTSEEEGPGRFDNPLVDAMPLGEVETREAMAREQAEANREPPPEYDEKQWGAHLTELAEQRAAQLANARRQAAIAEAAAIPPGLPDEDTYAQMDHASRMRVQEALARRTQLQQYINVTIPQEQMRDRATFIAQAQNINRVQKDLPSRYPGDYWVKVMEGIRAGVNHPDPARRLTAEALGSYDVYDAMYHQIRGYEVAEQAKQQEGRRRLRSSVPNVAGRGGSAAGEPRGGGFGDEIGVTPRQAEEALRKWGIGADTTRAVLGSQFRGGRR